MGTVRFTIEGPVKDYEGFSTFAKSLCEHIEAEEPGVLAYEIFADASARRVMLHELYADEEAFLTHVAHMNDTGRLAEMLTLMDFERITILNRITDERVRRIFADFNAVELHGMAGVAR